MITLRPFQEVLINTTRHSLQQGKKSPLLVSPCGSGKTVMFSEFSRRVTEKKKRTMILAHREELLEQISNTLNGFNVPHSFIAAGRPFNRSSPVQVASVFSVARRLDKIDAPDVIIIDEAHHAILGSTWSKVFDAFPKAWRIGVTATPQRMTGEALGDVFDDMILGPTVEELISMGYLCNYKLYVPSTIDTSGIATRMGDFDKKALGRAADTPRITGDAVKEYHTIAPGKRAVAFCVSIEHSKHVAAEFTAAGYVAMSIDGKMDREVRRGIVRDFREGKINVLTSCDLISEGFDLPAIEVAIMLRPTQSLALWIQQSGRALRPYPGKHFAIILDHAGNCERHGLPDEDRTWTLSGRTKRTGGDANGPSVRICPKCFAAQYPGTTACRFCGFVFDVAPRTVDQVAGDLKEVDLAVIRKQRNREQAQAQSFESLVELGQKRGYKNPAAWARFVFNSRRQKLAANAGPQASHPLPQG